MTHRLLLLIALACILVHANALPQQNPAVDPNVIGLFADVFGTKKSSQQQQQTTLKPLTGIAHVVTPVPNYTLVHANALPQQNPGVDTNVIGLFADVFGTKNSSQQQQTTLKPLTGIAYVVTPVPNDTIAENMTFTSISGRPQCKCVPYHMCDSKTNMPVDDDRFLIDIRSNKVDPACDHHLDVCCDGDHTRQESFTPRPQEQIPNRPKGCGVRNVGGIDFNITGAYDNEAGFGEFPWTVAILHASNFSYFCAGSLIHPRVVLTAVHCVIGRATNSFLIRAGEWDTQTVKERLPYEDRSVSKIVTHPEYNFRNVANDFALVILSTPFILDDHINVVCLPPANSVPASKTTCYSTGWGKDQFGAQGRYSVIMKRLPLPIVDYTTCQSQLRRTRLGPKFPLHRSFICAGGQLGVDTCQGDGGAPLVCPIGEESEQRYHQSGIVAWGIGCKDEIPAAYAHVGLARYWIDYQMYSNGFDTTSYSSNV